MPIAVYYSSPRRAVIIKLKVQGDTKKRELLKTPTKMEEMKQRNFIDKN